MAAKRAGPPRPRAWEAGVKTTLSDGDVRRLTAPEAYAILAGVIGYHVPKHLNEAARLSQALGRVR
jgi:hypothetical protein